VHGKFKTTPRDVAAFLPRRRTQRCGRR